MILGLNLVCCTKLECFTDDSRSSLGFSLVALLFLSSVFFVVHNVPLANVVGGWCLFDTNYFYFFL